jgi:hypothetical protein
VIARTLRAWTQAGLAAEVLAVHLLTHLASGDQGG